MAWNEPVTRVMILGEIKVVTTKDHRTLMRFFVIFQSALAAKGLVQANLLVR